MYGDLEIYNYLNVAAITSLLGTYDAGKKNLIRGTVIPKNATGAAVNIYQSVPYSPDNILVNTFTANCRDESDDKAKTLAVAVMNILHRSSKEGIGMYCTLLPVVPPA